MAICLLVTLSVIGNLSVDQILEDKEYVLAEAAKPIMGTLGFVIMGIAALFVKPLPGHESGYALLITGILILLISNILNLEAIAETGSMIFLIIYAMVNLASFKLRKETNSNPILVMVAFISMILAFFTLAFHEITQGDLSVYILLAVIFCTSAYQFIHQKLSFH